MGQKTVLHIKNELGPAGNRRITVFCPYWLVNLTQYSLLFKQGWFLYYYIFYNFHLNSAPLTPFIS
jgi:hypothetical protein